MTDTANSSQTIGAFLVPLHKQSLLLPSATVAEIIPYEPLQRIEDTPDWFLGVLGWRGVQAPVVSFEMLTAERASFSLASVSSASLVIVRALGGSDDLPWFALVAQTSPQRFELTPDHLFESEEPPERTERMKVRFQEEIVAIPDLDYIEAEIRKVSYV